MEFAQPEGYEASIPAGMCDLGSSRQNLQFDIFPAVTFAMIAAAPLSAQRPLPAVVVRFVRGQADRDLKPTLDPKIPGFADRTGSLW